MTYHTTKYQLQKDNETLIFDSEGDIIKTLANNGYNTITINCYKDIKSNGDDD